MPLEPAKPSVQLEAQSCLLLDLQPARAEVHQNDMKTDLVTLESDLSSTVTVEVPPRATTPLPSKQTATTPTTPTQKSTFSAIAAGTVKKSGAGRKGMRSFLALVLQASLASRHRLFLESAVCNPYEIMTDHTVKAPRMEQDGYAVECNNRVNLACAFSPIKSAEGVSCVD